MTEEQSKNQTTIWTEIINKYGVKTVVDLISNPPKILSNWVLALTSKDKRQKIWVRKLLFSDSPFPAPVSIHENCEAQRFEIFYNWISNYSEKENELDLTAVQKKVDEKLKEQEYIFQEDT